MMSPVSSNLGATAAPPATRVRAPGWRDPRLWIGIAIVAASVLVGARVLAGADDTVTVWAAADDLGAGQEIGPDDLVPVRVRFADDAALGRYFTSDVTLPSPMTLTRPVGSGELLPRAAVGSGRAAGLVQVPVSVPPNQVPDDVSSGTAVDVYLRASTSRGCQGQSACDGDPVLAGVTVVDAPAADDGFGAQGERKIVVAVRRAQARAYFRVLAQLDDPTVTVVGRG